MQNSIVQRKKCEKEESRAGFTSGGWRNWSRGQIHTLGQLFWVEVKQFGLRLLESEAADLWQSEWNDNHTDNPCCRPIYSGEGTSPLGSAAVGSWNIEIGEQSQGKVGSSLWWPEGTWRRRSQWDMLAKESQAKWRQEDTAESYTAGGPIPIASLSQNVSTDTWKTPERVAL